MIAMGRASKTCCATAGSGCIATFPRVPRDQPTPRLISNAVDQSSQNSYSTTLPVSLGIDLGTTNSVAAVVTPEQGPTLVPCSSKNADRNWVLPSVVLLKQDGSAVVGEAARRTAAVFPNNTFYSVKRIIGKDYDEIKEDVGKLAYQVCADDDGGAQILCPSAEDGTLYPEEVSGHVLLELINATAAETGCHVDRAVISVPAYFNEDQQEATIAAGQIAGLENIKLIKEPVASAFAYGLDLNEDQTVLVFDLGGGTFDVSILEVGNGVIEVLSTGGDAYLGGDDWDTAIMDYLDKNFLSPYGIESSDPQIRTNLRSIAESAKIALSNNSKVNITIPVGGPSGKGSQVVMSQQMMDELSAELFRRCRLPVDQACWQAGVDLGTVKEQYDKDMQRFNSSRASARGGKPEVVLKPKRRQPISEVCCTACTQPPCLSHIINRHAVKVHTVTS